MKQLKILPAYLLLFLTYIFAACKKNTSAPPPPSPNKNISSFIFKQTDNSAYIIFDITGNIDSDSISLIVPAETNITSLKPTIIHNGSSISPASGTTQNFSSPFQYTVHASDGSTKKYTVTVKYQNTVYIGTSNGNFFALDGKTGSSIWSIRPCSFISTAAIVVNGIVYFIGDNGLYAVDAITGQQKWKHPVTPGSSNNEAGTSPLYSNGKIYFGCWDGKLYCLDANNGNQLWSRASLTNQKFHTPVIFNNSIYVGCTDSLLYSLNATTGTINWTFLTNGPLLAKPLIVNNVIYIGSLGYPHFYAINASSGTLIWDQGQYINFSSPSFNNGIVYGCTSSNSLLALNSNTGSMVWEFRPNTPNSWNLRSSPITETNITYFAHLAGTVYACNSTTGAVIWQFATNGFIYSSPIVSEGIVFIGSDDGNLYALDAFTGNQKWKKNLSTQIRSSACVINSNGIISYPAVSANSN